MSGDPFSGLSRPQLEALSSVAFGGHGFGLAPRTMAVLEDRGLVTPTERRMGADRFGPIVVKAWEMSLDVHMAFCAWCAENDSITEPDHA